MKNATAGRLLVVLALWTGPALAARTCYYPDGTISSGDLACDENAKHSACCGAPPFGGTCLSTGICSGIPSGGLSRGSCTDPTWQSDACPKFCIGSE